MKAIVYEKYGSPNVLELKEMEKPSPSEDELLVRVHATSVNPAEWYAMKGIVVARLMSGFFKPKNNRLGGDFAGVVEAVGKNIKDFRAGDEVFGGRSGAFAEYVCVRNAVALKPANSTFEQAAALPTAAITALQGLRDHGKILSGSKVLINGASGGVGTFAVQIAKAFDAEVTAVCSPQNVALAITLGADHVVDYTKEDFTRSERRYDLILDIAGSRRWAEYKRVLKQDAILVIVGAPNTNPVIGPLSHVLNMKVAALRASQKVVFFVAQFKRGDFAILRELVESGKVTSVIDRQYELSELPEAMRYLGTGHAKGKIVVTMKEKAHRKK
ncbi:MAG: NAD(P)-dependent alcohol dehydrogenase [Anaerolineales bacterium]